MNYTDNQIKAVKYLQALLSKSFRDVLYYYDDDINIIESIYDEKNYARNERFLKSVSGKNTKQYKTTLKPKEQFENASRALHNKGEIKFRPYRKK